MSSSLVISETVEELFTQNNSYRTPKCYLEAPMDDPLIMLRTYHINKEEIVERDDQIIFGEFAWPKDVETNYLIFCKDKGQPKRYYNLQCLLYLLKNASLRHPVYVQQAVLANIPAIRRPDRKVLLAYLTGEKDTSTSIDKTAPSYISTLVKRKAQELSENAVKKQRIEIQETLGPKTN